MKKVYIIIVILHDFGLMEMCPYHVNLLFNDNITFCSFYLLKYLLRKKRSDIRINAPAVKAGLPSKDMVRR